VGGCGWTGCQSCHGYFLGRYDQVGYADAGSYFSLPLYEMGKAGIMINTVLMALNLFPLPPLDGGRIAVSLLPNRTAYKFARIEPYGMIILVVLLATNILGVILWPIINITLKLLSVIIGF